MSEDQQHREFEARAAALAKNTERELRAISWRMAVDAFMDDAPFVDAVLAVSGALLALLIPNLRDLVEVVDLAKLKLGLGLMLVSVVMGVLAKAVRKMVRTDMGESAPKKGRRLGPVLGKHISDFSKLKEEAAQAGIELKDPVDFGEFAAPFLQFAPPVIGRAILKEALHEDFTERRLKSAVKLAKLHSFLMVSQAAALAMAIGILLYYLHVPSP